jgi:hypothetical protein
MGSILDWDGIKQVLFDLFKPSDPSSFAGQYLHGTANGFETPARSDSTVQDVLIFNDLIFDIAVFILGIFLIFLVTKLMFTGGGHSTILKSGLRAILGIGLLAYNVELVFTFFEFTDGFVSALSWARTYYDSQTATETFGAAIGVTAVPVTPITTAFFGAHLIGYLFTWVAVAIIALSLILRDIILLGVIAFAPLMVVLWIFGPMVGVGRVGAGIAARALFFVIPLLVLLTLIEIVNPSVGTPAHNHILKSGSILAATWVSVKVSAAGRVVTGAIKTAGTTALLVGGAAAVGGTGLATRVGLSKTMGGTGSMIAKHLGNDSSDSAFTSSSTHSTPDHDSATFDRGSARDDYHDAFYSRNPDKIKESWDTRKPTIKNEPYFDSTKHAPNVNPIKQATEPNVIQADDHEREDLLFAKNRNLTDPDYTKLPMEDRKNLASGDAVLRDRGIEPNPPDIEGDPRK